MNDNSIELSELQDISKEFLEKIYHTKVNEINTIMELIVYLEGIIIDGYYQPLTCIINSIYQEKNSNNIAIKSWLDNNHNEDSCEKSKLSTEQIGEPQEDRIVLDFEKSENSNKVDLSIRYFEDGIFISNESKYFKDEDLNSEEFQKKVLDKIYKELYLYKHVDIILPQQFLLSDIKQWNYYDEDIESQVCFTQDCCVNIHMRERAFRPQIKELWKPVLKQLGETLDVSMKDMRSSGDTVTKETNEVGLKYRFLPDNAGNFSNRALRKMITLRCGDSEKLEEFNQWLDDNKDLILGQLKEEVDRSDNSHMTIMWSDPNIPLKGDGIDAK